MLRQLLVCCAIAFALCPVAVLAEDLLVTTTAEFSSALAAAQPGDSILLAPGEYAGGHYRAGLSGVTIRSQDAQSRAVITGGANGVQLSDATSVVLQDLIFQQQTGNGLNIDDGGSFDTPSTDITIRNVVVRDMAASGNNDGIKLSGVTGFLIDRVEVTNWGAGGSAVDPVGCHHGLIQNSRFISNVATGGSGIRPKGGSKDITIRANFVQMSDGLGRGIQAGGSTGSQYFRFIDGDSGYEAADIVVEGNVINGGSSSISWVNIDGGVFHHNYLAWPGDWAFRALNENVGAPIVETQNGVMRDNVVYYNADTWRRAGNYDGPGVLEETFQFAGNHWYNASNQSPADLVPQLPAPEVDGVYGDPEPERYSSPHYWDFPWGTWLVNTNNRMTDARLEDSHELLLATPGSGASFDPLAVHPLSGDWTYAPAEAEFRTEPVGQMVFIRPAFLDGLELPGDYDRSGAVDQGDYQLWRAQYGATGAALADGNHDGLVDAADYTLWRDAMSAQGSLDKTSAAPAPAAAGMAFVVLQGWLVWRPAKAGRGR